MKRVYSAIKSLCYAKTLIATNNQKSTVNKNRSAVISIIFFALLLVSANPSNAQTTNTKETTQAPAANVPAQAGTYQLIFNTRTQDADVKLNNFELMRIEKLRKDNEIVYARASYSDDIRVKILPRNVINQPGFKPLPLKYYKDEHDYSEWGQIRYVEFE